MLSVSGYNKFLPCKTRLSKYWAGQYSLGLFLLAHPAFRPKMSLCHRVASVVCCLSTIHKKCFSSLNSYPISIMFGLFERARACALNLLTDFRNFNSTSLIKDELLCYWHFVSSLFPSLAFIEYLIYKYPANTKHSYNVCTASVQRLRRWSNIVQMLYNIQYTIYVLNLSGIHAQSKLFFLQM